MNADKRGWKTNPSSACICVHLRLILLLPATAALLGSAALAATVRVELPSDRIRAGDLAQAVPQMHQADAAAELGFAPLPGVERRVSRREIVEWGADLGLALEPETLPEALLLSRKMERLPSRQVRGLVSAAVAERYQVSADQVEVELHSFAEPLLPAEPLDFELTSPLTRLGRPTHLMLRWTNSNGRSGNLSFRATAQVRGSYAVAREALEARSEISSNDFELIEGLLPGDPREFLMNAEDLDGKQLKQSLKAGQPLERRMIEVAQTVKRGDLIELQLRSRAIVLRTPARAEQSGATGDTIRCRNLESGVSVPAVITGSRQAEVISFR
ncbi:MAG: flagellar basal body P-ring formation chaperone FlgA [Bryobacterales bacterium]